MVLTQPRERFFRSVLSYHTDPQGASISQRGRQLNCAADGYRRVVYIVRPEGAGLKVIAGYAFKLRRDRWFWLR